MPQTVSDSTVSQEHEFDSSCGGNGAPDKAFLFTAPTTGPYTFDTAGSLLNAVLSLRDGGCDGPELACDSDNARNGTPALLSAQLTQGQQVAIVVDGLAVDDANVFTLRIYEGQITCPRADLGNTVPQSIADTTWNATDEFVLSCNSGNHLDFGYTFTAPEAGTYAFDTAGSNTSLALALFDPACGATQLACSGEDNSDNGGSGGLAAELSAGQEVTVVVDNELSAGIFTLSISQFGGNCPDEDLGSVAPLSVTGTTDADSNSSTASCAGLSSPDHTYTWTAPETAVYIIDTVGSQMNAVVYARMDDCAGAELGCGPGNINLAVNAGDQIAITVDGAGDQGDYTLNIHAAGCPGSVLGGPPIAQPGTTTGLPSVLESPCGAPGSQAPEQDYDFTAPNTGTYVFQTTGATFSASLSVHDTNACVGPALACENFGAPLTLGLNAGQNVRVVVDGVQSVDAGEYLLTIDEVMCPVPTDLGNVVPQLLMGNSNMMAMDFALGQCGNGGSGREVPFLFTAPQDATYRFSTDGSNYDTIVYALATDAPTFCGGAHLGCDDDGGLGLQSQLDLPLLTGQQIFVMLDGFIGSGDWMLSVSQL